MTPTRVIDCHVHLYPPEINRDPAGWAAAEGEPHWAALCARRRRGGRPVQSFPALGELLDAMDGAEVERVVLLGWYWQNPANCALQNRFYAECVRSHPDRLSACATLHPAAGEAATSAEIRRAADEGLAGLGELSPHAQGYSVSDPVFRTALALAGELRFPVNLHVDDPDGRAYPGRVATPLADFAALALETPGTTFVLAHWGGLLPLRHPEAAGLPNLYYDTAASPLVYDGRVWGRFLGRLGSDRLLFGSDYPLDLYPERGTGPRMDAWVAEARLALPESARSAVLRENARRLFGKGFAPSRPGAR